MRILLDECVHAGVKAAFLGHTVKTVSETGWRSAKDAPLLLYAQDNFDVFVTVDGSLERQRRIDRYSLGFVIGHVPNNKIGSYLPIFGELHEAVSRVRAGTAIHVWHPSVRRRV